MHPPTPEKAFPRGRGLDEAEYVCCALKHVQKLGSPNRPTYACSGWPVTSTDCEEKRDPRQDATNNMP